ncbi:MAG: hypothetical protein KGH65_04080 [Candidatus Micrarchaeota archaeon]|nr:hypothetical protein [Candidatus Micrarchaeota archaeon]
MEVQKNHDQWVKKKFAYALSQGNEGRLTEAVLKRLIETKAERIFYVGYSSKPLRGLANVLVKTAYEEMAEYVHTGSESNTLLERRMFFADPEIIEACNSVGETYGKPIVYALNDMFDRLDRSTERVKEVLRYVGLRRDDAAAYDIHSMEQIAKRSDALNEMWRKGDRERLMVNVLIDTRRYEEEITGLEQLRVDEELEMQKADPDWFNNNALY